MGGKIDKKTEVALIRALENTKQKKPTKKVPSKD
jgi:hypothetical protein